MPEAHAAGPAFWCLAVAIIVCALGVVLAQNMVHSALALAGVLMFIGGLYLNLQADLLAGFQVLIYVGAVVTLILVAVMLIQNIAARDAVQTNRRWLQGGVVAVAALATLVWVIADTRWPTSEAILQRELSETLAAGGVAARNPALVTAADVRAVRQPELAAQAQELWLRIRQVREREAQSTFDSRMREFCHALIDTYVLPFELAAVLLLVALAGAIVIAQQTEREEGPQ